MVVEVDLSWVFRVDVSWSVMLGVVCMIMIVDCLLVLFCDCLGICVVVVYVGWCGLVVGVLEVMVDSLGVFGDELLVWLGLVIGLQVFEVGGEVCDVFVVVYVEVCLVFVFSVNLGCFMVDIY